MTRTARGAQPGQMQSYFTKKYKALLEGGKNRYKTIRVQSHRRGVEHNWVVLVAAGHQRVYGKREHGMLHIDPWIDIYPRVYTHKEHIAPTNEGIR